MQTQQLPVLDSSYQHSSQLSRSSVPTFTNPFKRPTNHTEHCALAADAAFERCAGRAMQSLSLPPPTSVPSTPFGRLQEPGSGRIQFPQFSPGRPEQHSYPSPPMSDSHSPARRSAHIVEQEGRQHATPRHEAHRLDGLAPHPPPPPSSLLDPRSATTAHGIAQQRPLYSGESQPRSPPVQHQAGRALEPPYGGMQISQSYGYGYPPSGVPTYLGSQGAAPGPQVQPSAIVAPQPLKQNKPARRTKAHVASACVNCKKAHLSCDVQRPCGRCVASGKQDTCKDVQHKKRGRPRLRDDKEFGRSEEVGMAPTQIMGALPPSGADTVRQQPPFPTGPRVPESYRVLASAPEDKSSNSRLQPRATATGAPPQHASSYSAVTTSPYSARPDSVSPSVPVAFLDLDLVIQKTNKAFQDLVGLAGDARGNNLVDLLDGRQQDVVQHLRFELRLERDEREPAYMAPITPVGQNRMQPVMESVSENDVDQVSQGFTDRPVSLNFRLSDGQHQSFQTQIRLAKTSLYFVTLVVHIPFRHAGPPLLTQQLAPPTPVRTSQPMSAPARDFGTHPLRPTSSTSSAPSSPYFNFHSVRTSLPTASSSSFGASPYGYSPTAGPEQGYFPTYQPPSQPGAYPSSYQPGSRPGSVASEAQRGARPARLEGLQLPPIRTTPAAPLGSPLAQDFGEGTQERERARRRTSLSSAEARPDTPDTNKRRRLNIHEVLQ